LPGIDFKMSWCCVLPMLMMRNIVNESDFRFNQRRLGENPNLLLEKSQ